MYISNQIPPMPPRSVLKYKDYEVHAISTRAGERLNINIATWMMQSAMKAKYLSVALYKPDYTIELVRESGILNVNLLAIPQKRHVNRLGRKSGRDTNKFNRLPHDFDERGCPYLTEAIGYVQCKVHDIADSGDHEIFVCEILRQRVLNPDQEVLTHGYLKEKRLSYKSLILRSS